MTRYAVLGPGGVGGLLAAVLADRGHEVVVVARVESVNVLQDNGIRVKSGIFGDLVARPRVVSVLDRPVDVVLVAAKATALEPALRGIPAEVVGDALVVPFLNGLDHMDVLRRRYPSVAAGVIRVESSRPEVGVIVHSSPFARVQVATAEPRLHDRVAAVVRDLADSGFDAELGGYERAMLWDKLAFLAPFALLTTAHGAPVGDVREHHAEEMVSVIEEVAAVSAADGGSGDPAVTVAQFQRLGAEMKSSMLRDAEAGNPLELDAIGGAVLRAAEAHGIPIPRTRALVERLTESGKTVSG